MRTGDQGSGGRGGVQPGLVNKPFTRLNRTAPAALEAGVPQAHDRPTQALIDPSMTTPLSTIGYEASTLPRVIESLKTAGVELLLDVRAVASSRKAGFSKTLLGATLEAEGVGYRHLRDLGTPKAGRQAAKAGRTAEMHDIFNVHMRTDAAQAALEQAVALSRERRVCLMCYEADWRCCHRAIVADLMTGRTGAPIVHLHPTPDLP